MPDDPNTKLIDPKDPSRALMLLTRLPVPGADGERAAASAWAWPIVGLVVGGLSGCVAYITTLAGMTPAIAAGLTLAAGALMTGALHEDGLADCADGFWGASDTERRLEIMKDSRIGAYGVLALIFVIGLKWLALTSLIEANALWPAVLVPAALSRSTMAGLMADLPFARHGGLAHHIGKPPKLVAGIAFGLGALLAVVISGLAGIVAVTAVGAASIALAQLARAKIGGQTGDVLGAAQQLTELTSLLVLAAVLTA